MDTDERIHIELLKSLKRFSKSYVPNESHGKHSNLNSDESPVIHQKHILKKKPFSDVDEKLFMLSHYYSKNKKYILIDQIKMVHRKHSHEIVNWRKFSPDLKKMKLNDNNSPKQQHSHHKSNQLDDDLHGKCKLRQNIDCSIKEKTIKINLVNQKFKIADDFNEKKSNEFLNEKDECMTEVILSDKIEEEESNPIFDENAKGRISGLSTIRIKEYNDSLNDKKVKRKKVEDDSIKFLSELIENLN